MIRVAGLRKAYGSVVAVDGLDFTVREGEIFGLLGPNGAGKTTTLSVISTLLPADAGRVIVDGLDVARHPRAVRRRLGVVPQELALYEDLTGLENLLFWGRLHGLQGRALRERVTELLEIGGLAPHAGRLVKGYSGGMKRRLNMMIGLVHAPRLLLLDEPTVGIDAQARRRILELVQEMNRQGLTVLYTTHYLEEAEQLCHRLGVIDHGRLVALGDREQLIRQVGERDTIRFSLPPALRESLAAAASGWPGVVVHGERRGKMELECPDGAALLPRLQAWLAEHGAALAQLEIRRPDLESLYISITGRELRE